MPRKPRPPCRICGKLAEPNERYCKEHLKQINAEQNRNYNKYKRDQEAQAFYESAQWRAVRARHIQEEPLCRMCLKEGRLTPAKIVDHIVPISQGGERLDDNNLQSLCNYCHEVKSNAEGSRGSGAR